MAPWRARYIKHLINPIYMGSLAITNMIFSIILLGSYEVLSFRDVFDPVIIIVLIVNLFFFFDMMANFIVLRPVNVWNNKKFLYLELIFQFGQITIFFIYMFDQTFAYKDLVF